MMHREWSDAAVSEEEKKPEPIDGLDKFQNSSLHRWLQESIREQPYNNVAEFRTIQMVASDLTAFGSCVGAVRCETCGATGSSTSRKTTR